MHLTLDSALGAGSVAIYDGGKLLEFCPIAERGSQAKLLVSTIQECLAAQSLKPEHLSAIYCTVGPGGFTGIRIALSAAQALSMTLDIPLIGLSTLACIASEYCVLPSAAPIMTAILPASRGNVYMQSFEAASLKPLDDATMVSLDELHSDMNLMKLNTPEIRGLEIEAITIPAIDARSIGRLIAHEGFRAYHQLPADPLYIRPPDAKLPSKKV